LRRGERKEDEFIIRAFRGSILKKVDGRGKEKGTGSGGPVDGPDSRRTECEKLKGPRCADVRKR